MSNKTSVQLLHEYCVKNKTNLEFKVIQDETGSHKPTYIFRAEAFDNHATGEGSTIKQAKQEAAKNLIEILKIPPDWKVAKEKVETVNNVPEKTENINAINQLAVYCLNKKHPTPQYDSLEEKGPDHDKSFAVRCSVSGLHEVGEAKQRKRARHISAFKMLKRLKTEDNKDTASIENGTEVSSSSTEVTNNIPPDTKAANGTSANSDTADGSSSVKKTLDFDKKKVFERLSEFKRPYDPTPAVNYKDHHRALVGIHEKSLTLKKIIDCKIKNDMESAVELLGKVAEELKVTKDLKKYNNKDENKPHLYMWKLSTDPEITAVGHDENSAANNLLNTLIVMSAEIIFND